MAEEKQKSFGIILKSAKVKKQKEEKKLTGEEYLKNLIQQNKELEKTDNIVEEKKEESLDESHQSE